MYDKFAQWTYNGGGDPERSLTQDEFNPAEVSEQETR
jgi:hypothetical protein